MLLQPVTLRGNDFIIHAVNAMKKKQMWYIKFIVNSSEYVFECQFSEFNKFSNSS